MPRSRWSSSKGFGERRPSLLSGGQRQRVALARCLVTEPSLVLLDEPLANLDVHLRAAMEDEFARFHERTGTTMIYITHDQAEAMALADRIAVMDRGPRAADGDAVDSSIASRRTTVVAGFIGEGMVRAGRRRRGVDGDGDLRRRASSAIGCACAARRRNGPAARARVRARVRARARRAAGTPGLRARVERAVYQGGHFRLERERRSGSRTAALHLDGPGAVLRVDARR